MVIDSSKQLVLDAYPKAIQQIEFAGYFNWGGKTVIFFIIEEEKETIVDFWKEM